MVGRAVANHPHVMFFQLSKHIFADTGRLSEVITDKCYQVQTGLQLNATAGREFGQQRRGQRVCITRPTH